MSRIELLAILFIISLIANIYLSAKVKVLDETMKWWRDEALKKSGSDDKIE